MQSCRFKAEAQTTQEGGPAAHIGNNCIFFSRLTFRLRWMRWLLWGQRSLGHLRCFNVLGILGQLWRLRVAGLLRLQWQQQRGVGGRRLGVNVTLLLPGQARALHIVLPQVPDGVLHVRVRVGVAVSRGADLLEVIWGAGRGKP